MNNNKNYSSSGGLGFSGLLTIVFIALKLLGVIEWSWIWVLSPLWIGVIVTVLLVIVLTLLVCWLDKDEHKENDKWKF